MNKVPDEVISKIHDTLTSNFTRNLVEVIKNSIEVEHDLKYNKLYHENRHVLEVLSKINNLILGTDESFYDSSKKYDSVLSNIQKALSNKSDIKVDKILVFSVPHEDHHSTYVVNRKSIDFLEAILDSNSYEYEDYDMIDDDLYSDIKKHNKLSDAEVDAEADEDDDNDGSVERKHIINFFNSKLKSKTYSLFDYQNDIIKMIPRQRGSWSSFAWV